MGKIFVELRNCPTICLDQKYVLREDQFSDVEELRIACDKQARLVGRKFTKQDLAKLRLSAAKYPLDQNGGSIIPCGSQVMRQ